MAVEKRVLSYVGHNESSTPYLSPDDACKLDDVRDALRRGDIRAASDLSRVFELRPVASQ